MVVKIKPTKKLFLTQKYAPKKMYVKEIHYSERLLGSQVDVYLTHPDGRDTGTFWTYLMADVPECIKLDILNYKDKNERYK